MRVRKKDGTLKEIVYTEAQLYRYGINRLSEREWGRAELQKKMVRLQPDVEMIGRVLDKLESQSYLSDERRVRMMVTQFERREGARKIRQRLSEKGLPRDVVEAVLEEKQQQAEESGETENERAAELLQRKFRQYSADNYAKMSRFLISRGFGGTSLKFAIEALKTHTESEEST
jgi:SOS response regulatory protein OraA/RecX